MTFKNARSRRRLPQMFTLASIALGWSSDWLDRFGPLVVLIAVIFFVVEWYIRGGRNAALERILLQNDFGSPAAFRGTLAVAEPRAGSYLCLSKSTRAARRLQFKYRWLSGVGPQAFFEEATFDKSRGLVELKTKTKLATSPFSEVSAIQMREVARGRFLASLWHIELVRNNGKAIPFVTSEAGDRKAMFEGTGPVAKAVSVITGLPVHAFVAGNIWTPG